MSEPNEKYDVHFGIFFAEEDEEQIIWFREFLVDLFQRKNLPEPTFCMLGRTNDKPEIDSIPKHIEFTAANCARVLIILTENFYKERRATYAAELTATLRLYSESHPNDTSDASTGIICISAIPDTKKAKKLWHQHLGFLNQLRLTHLSKIMNLFQEDHPNQQEAIRDITWDIINQKDKYIFPTFFNRLLEITASTVLRRTLPRSPVAVNPAGLHHPLAHQHTMASDVLNPVSQPAAWNAMPGGASGGHVPQPYPSKQMINNSPTTNGHQERSCSLAQDREQHTHLPNNLGACGGYRPPHPSQQMVHDSSPGSASQDRNAHLPNEFRASTGCSPPYSSQQMAREVRPCDIRGAVPPQQHPSDDVVVCSEDTHLALLERQDYTARPIQKTMQNMMPDDWTGPQEDEDSQTRSTLYHAPARPPVHQGAQETAAFDFEAAHNPLRVQHTHIPVPPNCAGAINQLIVPNTSADTHITTLTCPADLPEHQQNAQQLDLQSMLASNPALYTQMIQYLQQMQITTPAPSRNPDVDGATSSTSKANLFGAGAVGGTHTTDQPFPTPRGHMQTQLPPFDNTPTEPPNGENVDHIHEVTSSPPDVRVSSSNLMRRNMEPVSGAPAKNEDLIIAQQETGAANYDGVQPVVLHNEDLTNMTNCQGGNGGDTGAIGNMPDSHQTIGSTAATDAMYPTVPWTVEDPSQPTLEGPDGASGCSSRVWPIGQPVDHDADLNLTLSLIPDSDISATTYDEFSLMTESSIGLEDVAMPDTMLNDQLSLASVKSHPDKQSTRQNNPRS